MIEQGGCGCVVIEQLVVALDKRAKAIESLNDEMEVARAEVSRAFLASLAGCFFYAPPLKGLVPSEDLLKHVFGGLNYSKAVFADLCLDSTKLKEVSEEFMQARSKHVKLMALIEGFHTRGVRRWIRFGHAVVACVSVDRLLIVGVRLT